MRKDATKDAVISFENAINKEDMADYVAKIVSERIQQGEKEEDICIIAPRWELIFPMVRRAKASMKNFDNFNLSVPKWYSNTLGKCN